MCICPMVVSQWGLNSKNNPGQTGPGHSMVISQWSSSEHRVHQSTWRTSAHPQRCPRTARGGGESSSSYRLPGAQGPTLRGARARSEGGRE